MYEICDSINYTMLCIIIYTNDIVVSEYKKNIHIKWLYFTETGKI